MNNTIAFCGTHRVGKTTLAERLHKDHFPDLQLIVELNSQLTTCSRGADADVEAAKRYLGTFKAARWSSFISDRAVIDSLAYGAANGHYCTIETLASMALAVASRVSHLFFVPIAIVVPVSDGVYQELVDQNIRAFFECFEILHHCVRSIKLEDRVQEVWEVVQGERQLVPWWEGEECQDKGVTLPRRLEETIAALRGGGAHEVVS